MELALFAVWCFLVAFAGGLVGLVLGNIRLPATLLVASSAAAGGGANLAISAIAALTAATVHIRHGRINWRLVAWMAPPSIVGAVAGGYLAGAIPEWLLLDRDRRGADPVGGRAAAQPAEAGRRRRRRARRPRGGAQRRGDRSARRARRPDPRLAADARAAALGRRDAQRAVGTNVTVGVFVGVAGALGAPPERGARPRRDRLGGAASIPGALLGSRLTGRLSEAALIKAIAVVLLVAAAGCIAQALT